MKRLIATSVFVFLVVCTASARQQSREQSLLARVTVYWASGGGGSDRYTRQHKCATGMRLRTGHCAVDPKRIPYGSQIIFPDRSTLLAVDTGTAVRNRKAARKAGRTVYERNAIVVDRFFETKRQALTWTRQNPAFMTLRVVAPNYRAQTVAQSTLQKLPNPPPIASNAMLPASKPAAVKMSRVSLPKSGYKAL